MILYGVCWQELHEPWGWEPRAIHDDQSWGQRWGVQPFRYERTRAEADLHTILESFRPGGMMPEEVGGGRWRIGGGYLSVQEFECEEIS